MAQEPIAPVVDYLRRLVSLGDAEGLTDRQLLERFAQAGDDASFAALVRRHGGLVMRVCQRVLRHQQDAEDAMQATFLVLAKKVGAVSWSESVAGWLHAVAVRVSANLRQNTMRRRVREKQVD